jgi:hypothetical protein
MADKQNEKEGSSRKVSGVDTSGRSGLPDRRVPVETSPIDVDMPPFFKTWSALYALVLAQLLLMIAGFYFFTKLFE